MVSVIGYADPQVDEKWLRFSSCVLFNLPVIFFLAVLVESSMRAESAALAELAELDECSAWLRLCSELVKRRAQRE